MQKDFDTWNQQKKKLHIGRKVPWFHEHEVVWGHVGINIGHEQDGKGLESLRPVLVLRKFNKHLFLGVPLTTRQKKNPFYKDILFQKKQQKVIISQVKILSSNRIKYTMGRVSRSDWSTIKKAINTMIDDS